MKRTLHSGWLIGLLALACNSSGSDTGERTPAGTPTDPVEVCTRAADVCRLDGAKLGVCVEPSPDTRPEACADRDPCFICMSQH